MKALLAALLLCSCGATDESPDTGAGRDASRPYVIPDASAVIPVEDMPWCCNVFCQGTDPLPCTRQNVECSGSRAMCAYSCAKDPVSHVNIGYGWEECSADGVYSGQTGPFNCRCRTQY